MVSLSASVSVRSNASWFSRRVSSKRDWDIIVGLGQWVVVCVVEIKARCFRILSLDLSDTQRGINSAKTFLFFFLPVTVTCNDVTSRKPAGRAYYACVIPR